MALGCRDPVGQICREPRPSRAYRAQSLLRASGAGPRQRVPLPNVCDLALGKALGPWQSMRF